MARPKMTVAAALSIGRVQGYTADYPIVQEVMRFAAISPGDVGANKQAEMTTVRDGSGVEDEQNDDVRVRKKPLQAGDSSSVKLENPAAEGLAGSDFEHPCVTLQETQNFEKQEGGRAEFMCTACGYSVAIAEVQAHPVLNVGVCGACYKFLFSSPFTKDNPQDPSEHENECRWCGDGGEIVLCDTCPKAFCKPCIKRNFGAGVLTAIETLTRQWQCFVCDDNLLQTLICEYKILQTLVKTTMNRNGPAPKRRTMRPTLDQSDPKKSKKTSVKPRDQYFREHFARPRGPSISKTTFPEDTIATIIEREKVKMQRQPRRKRFTGFEVPNQRRTQRSRHSPFARTRTKTEQAARA